MILKVKNGALGGIRTPDPLVRSQVLYPTELPAQVLKSGDFTDFGGALPVFLRFFIGLLVYVLSLAMTARMTEQFVRDRFTAARNFIRSRSAPPQDDFIASGH